MNHKEWLDNEYSQWIKALNESTVHNFKEHPVVKRILGEVDARLFRPEPYPILEMVLQADGVLPMPTIYKIEQIGHTNQINDISGTCWRYVYYALKLLERNPTSICEIGGGVGQFYAILRALGYKGEYYIYDLPEVCVFQRKYLAEVEKQTGLKSPLLIAAKVYESLCISFYALGEFDDEKRDWYLKNVIPDCPHGYIAWNPHSGASDDLSLFKHDIKVTPGIEEGIKIIEW